MMTKQQRDEGFSLIELLLVIVVLGILATVVVASVGGFTAEAEETGCDGDVAILSRAVEAYFAEHGGATIPAANATPDGMEQTLVDAEFLRGVSEYHDVAADGKLVPVAGSICAG